MQQQCICAPQPVSSSHCIDGNENENSNIDSNGNDSIGNNNNNNNNNISNENNNNSNISNENSNENGSNDNNEKNNDNNDNEEQDIDIQSTLVSHDDEEKHEILETSTPKPIARSRKRKQYTPNMPDKAKKK